MAQRPAAEMPASGNPSDRTARVVVWSVWAGMLALLLWSYIPIASPVPLAEDWFAVPLFTGQAVHLPGWLWEQNNEHRMPVARLLLLGAVKAAGGDYRAVGLLNMALLAGIAAGLMLFVRHLRGGRTDVADAFFPLLFLHFGHSIDVLFPFQITYVLSFAFILVLGCALFLNESLTGPRAAAIGGIALLLLPLSGFIGLAFVPATAAYGFFLGWASRRANDGRATASWLMAASAGAVALSALYFVGYRTPSWTSAETGIVASSKIVLKMFAFGLGPAVAWVWTPTVITTVLFVAASCWVAGRRLLQPATARARALGGPLFLANTLAFAAAVAWGRAGYVLEAGEASRYIWLMAPALVACYLTWVRASSRVGRLVLRACAVVMLILLPFNTVAGHRFFADWYREGMTRLIADIDQGVPIDELAARHQPFLIHWWSASRLARHMRMLHEAGVAPFDRAAVRPPQRP